MWTTSERFLQTERENAVERCLGTSRGHFRPSEGESGSAMRRSLQDLKEVQDRAGKNKGAAPLDGKRALVEAVEKTVVSRTLNCFCGIV